MIQKDEEAIPLQKCIELMRNKEINELLISELVKDGLGGELYRESLENK